MTENEGNQEQSGDETFRDLESGYRFQNDGLNSRGHQDAVAQTHSETSVAIIDRIAPAHANMDDERIERIIAHDRFRTRQYIGREMLAVHEAGRRIKDFLIPNSAILMKTEVQRVDGIVRVE